MTYSPNKTLLSKAKIVWKTLVVLVLSVLLFAPTPALAFDYSGTLQSYVSSAKVEIDGVVTSIKKLPTQSYENGKTTLTEIDTKLHKIQTDAGNNAKTFQNLSAQAQKDYEQVLAQLNQKDASFTLRPNQTTNLLRLTNATNELLPVRIITPVRSSSMGLPAQKTQELSFNVNIEQTITFAIARNSWFGDKNPANYFFTTNGNNVTIRQTHELDIKKQRLANGIVLTNKISKLCDDLEKRVNLAKQKSGNVKEYADALQSFNDPDILSEIADLNKFVADLTNNLSLAT